MIPDTWADGRQAYFFDVVGPQLQRPGLALAASASWLAGHSHETVDGEDLRSGSAATSRKMKPLGLERVKVAEFVTAEAGGCLASCSANASGGLHDIDQFQPTAEKDKEQRRPQDVIRRLRRHLGAAIHPGKAADQQ